MTHPPPIVAALQQCTDLLADPHVGFAQVEALHQRLRARCDAAPLLALYDAHVLPVLLRECEARFTPDERVTCDHDPPSELALTYAYSYRPYQLTKEKFEQELCHLDDARYAHYTGLTLHDLGPRFTQLVLERMRRVNFKRLERFALVDDYEPLPLAQDAARGEAFWTWFFSSFIPDIRALDVHAAELFETSNDLFWRALYDALPSLERLESLSLSSAFSTRSSTHRAAHIERMSDLFDALTHVHTLALFGMDDIEKEGLFELIDRGHDALPQIDALTLDALTPQEIARLRAHPHLAHITRLTLFD